MNKIKYLEFVYLFCSVRACSACWIEQKVIQNFGGEKMKKGDHVEEAMQTGG
jgi:hypothetical protein